MITPRSISSVVVLPAPLGPSRPTRAPAGTRQVQSVDRGDGLEPLRERAQLDHVARHPGSLAARRVGGTARFPTEWHADEMARARRHDQLSLDARKVLLAQALRAVVDGFGSVHLGIVLEARGWLTARIGLLLTCVVAGLVR